MSTSKISNFKRVTVDELVKEVTVRQFLVLDFLVKDGSPKEPVHTSQIYGALATNSLSRQSKIADTIHYLYKHGFIDGRWGTLGNANSIEIRILEKGLEALDKICKDQELSKSLLMQSVHPLNDMEM